LLIGGGMTQHDTAPLLVLAGMTSAGVAIYFSQLSGGCLPPTALSCLCSPAWGCSRRRRMRRKTYDGAAPV
jgi:hypothetical protein